MFKILDKNNKPFTQNDPRRIFNLGNRLWHTDSSFKEIPAKYSLLSARNISKEGGNTEFADMRSAYDNLDMNTKQKVDDMICEHSLIYSRQRLGFDMVKELSSEEIKKLTEDLVQNFTSKMKLNYKHNKSLIGGLVVKIGSTMIDTSIKNKLQQIENKMIEA